MCLRMQNRLQKLLDSERLSPARFAEILGVQRSAISHILTGRNNPSFDLISKIVLKFPALNSEWLITGKGNMYKTVAQRSLFDLENTANDGSPSKKTDAIKPPFCAVTNVTLQGDSQDNTIDTSVKSSVEVKRSVKKIVVFYTDNTFEEFITAP